MSLYGSSQKSKSRELQKRVVFLVPVVFFAFAILVTRLWQLQIVHGEEYYRQTQNNIVKERFLPSLRGKILAFGGEPIAHNRPAFHIYAVPADIDETAESRISTALQLSPSEREIMHARLEKSRNSKGEIRILSDQPRDRAALIRQERQLFGELTVRDEASRVYPQGKVAAFLVGYISQINERELAAKRRDGYRTNSLIGRRGLERNRETYLRGKQGVERYVANASHKRIEGPDTERLIGKERYVPPITGHNIILNIDIGLQTLIEKAIRESEVASGGAAVIEVATGRILALASAPSFDPNEMSGHLTHARMLELNSDPRGPRKDKTLQLHYPPGSTYKFVPAIAALKKHLIQEDEPLSCTGVHRVGNRAFRCAHVHIKVDMFDALKHSCNVYFWKLSERLGLDAIGEVARDFGFGEPTGLGLNGDVAGLIPTQAWYEERDRYKIGHALNAAVGQGDVEVSILQLAMAYAALANGGKLFSPQLVNRIESVDGELVIQYTPQLRRQVDVSPTQLEIIKTGMWKVVNEVGGTAYDYARSDIVEYVAKTGTAQVKEMRRRDDDNHLEGWHTDRDHAWYAGFSPAENPEIAFVVFLEHGGSGGKSAGPIGRAIVEYIQKKNHPETAVRSQEGVP